MGKFLDRLVSLTRLDTGVGSLRSPRVDIHLRMTAILMMMALIACVASFFYAIIVYADGILTGVAFGIMASIYIELHWRLLRFVATTDMTAPGWAGFWRKVLPPIGLLIMGGVVALVAAVVAFNIRLNEYLLLEFIADAERLGEAVVYLPAWVIELNFFEKIPALYRMSMEQPLIGVRVIGFVLLILLMSGWAIIIDRFFLSSMEVDNYYSTETKNRLESTTTP